MNKVTKNKKGINWRE